jgi:hypothetical protein
VTICVAVMTSDGLVIGTDSMVTVAERSYRATTYEHGDKLFQILDLPAVAVTYGMGSIRRRSIASLIDEWRETVLRNFTQTSFTVRGLIEALSEAIAEKHTPYVAELRDEWHRGRAAAADGREPPTLDESAFHTGLIVGGYQPGGFFPYLFQWDSESGQITEVFEHEGLEHGPRPGVKWWGIETAMNRLVRGMDEDLIKNLQRAGYLHPPAGGTDEYFEFMKLLVMHEWQVVYDGMPLQDAVNLTAFLLETASGFERYKAGPTRIGGPFDIVVVSRTKVHWASDKQLSRALRL